MQPITAPRVLICMSRPPCTEQGHTSSPCTCTAHAHQPNTGSCGLRPWPRLPRRAPTGRHTRCTRRKMLATAWRLPVGVPTARSGAVSKEGRTWRCFASTGRHAHLWIPTLSRSLTHERAAGLSRRHTCAPRAPEGLAIGRPRPDPCRCDGYRNPLPWPEQSTLRSRHSTADIRRTRAP